MNGNELLLIYNILVKAKSPYDVFTSISNFDNVEKHYKSVIRVIHPDLYNGDAKLMYMAEESTKLLNSYYQQAKDILSGKVPVKISTKCNTKYDAYFKNGDYEYGISNKYIDDNFCKVYFGERKSSNGDTEDVCLKISKDVDDNFLLNNEYHILMSITHKSIPIMVDSFVSDNGNAVNVMRRIKDSYDLNTIKEKYPNGVPQEHAVWMMDRLLSVIGYLHINNVIHGGIEPSNILITPFNHNATLIDYTFAIGDADKPDAKYYGVNEFSASEIETGAIPHPSADMYSFGKVMKYIMTNEKGMFPNTVDKRIINFLSGFLKEDPSIRSNDAWKSWHELVLLREQIFGKKNQFLPFDIK